MGPIVAGTLDTASLYHRPRREISGIKQRTMFTNSAKPILKHDRQNPLKLHEFGELTQLRLAKYTASYHGKQ